MIRIEHNAETGEIKEIELTPAEIKKIEGERAEIAANPAPAPAVVSVEDKLASVGLSVSDLKAALGL
jgi:antitoxin component HigA of HigAB toxin-antitoxin module